MIITDLRDAWIDRLGRLLLVTLEAARVNAELPVLVALRSWLDSRRGIGAVEPDDQRPGSCRRLAIVTCRNSMMRRRNSVAVNGFGMKPMHPARTSAFACSAVPEVRATTGILRVVGSALSFSITARPSMPGIW